MPTDPHLDVSEAVRVQILATEHWSLLATRNITYGAIYNRANIFLTVVSAAVVALALAAEATEFGVRGVIRGSATCDEFKPRARA